MRPIIVRLPNWVGDVIMSLPTLWHLHQRNYQLLLVGKSWASTLLNGTPWAVHRLPDSRRDRIQLLRRLRHKARSEDVEFNQRLNMLLLTNSFSSALEARWAGLKAIGYRQDGRGWLLRHAHAQPQGIVHESERFWELGLPLAPVDDRPGADVPPCPVPRLPLNRNARQQAQVLLEHQGLANPAHPESIRPYACLIPFATGTLNGVGKAWPGFPALCRHLSKYMPVLILPAPGDETSHTRLNYPDARCLTNVGLDVYAAILARAALVVSNDTGPGHMAAAVGSRLISVLGPTDARRYRALGSNVSILQHSPWPSDEFVWKTVNKAIQALQPPLPPA
ncbi:MAG: glycosyltransferase family 9 protein [Lautropia sp.]|nr:glycosyltransferase family 9 protein [Lautropia sp.]